MAGSPSVVDKVLGFIADNGYTRAYARGVNSGVVAPVEVALMQDLPSWERLNNATRNLMDKSGQLTPQGVKYLDEVIRVRDDGNGKGERMRGRFESENDASVKAAMLAIVPKKVDGEDRRRLLRLAAVRDFGYAGYTQTGDIARFVLGNPAAAYGVPLAGAGLATWGLHDLLTAEQRQQKESQLPLEQVS